MDEIIGTKPVEEMTAEEIEAERAAIAAYRAAQSTVAYRAAQATAEPVAGFAVPKELDPTADPAIAAYQAALDEPEDPFADPEPEDAPAWPHQHLTYGGLELEVRTPQQGALMAISMLQELDGFAEMQMKIFNTFIANHLSARSLADFLNAMLDPDNDLTMQGLVQALVRLRVQEG